MTPPPPPDTGLKKTGYILKDLKVFKCYQCDLTCFHCCSYFPLQFQAFGVERERTKSRISLLELQNTTDEVLLCVHLTST